MVTRLRFRSAAALFSCLIAVTAYAQDPTPPSPAPAPPNLAYVEGAVDLVLDGVTERADPPVMLLDGDVVRTRRGRAEVVFGDGTLLHVSDDSELEVLGEQHLRLVSGRMMVRVAHSAARPYVIDTPASSVRLDPDGEYGVTAEHGARLEVAVARGAATVLESSPWSIHGGQMLTLAAAGSRPLIQPFNSARWDAFERWAYERANGFATSYSATQLPYELRPYGPVLDSYGRWDDVAPHGRVWFPAVSAGWRPYFDGSWSFTHFGWTWRGRDRWAWPTHHYGRWGFRDNFWFWIPARTWAPAWVSWSVAPGFVSWAPLGWDNHPSIGFWRRRDHPAYWPDHTPWRAWTVVPRHHFAPRRDVRVHAIDGARLDDNTRRSLAQAVPRFAGNDVAVPRDTVTGAPIRGSVRRPQRSYPASAYAEPGASTTPTPLGPADVPAATSRSRRPVDNSAYAPRDSGAATADRSAYTPRDRRDGSAYAPRDPGAAPADKSGYAPRDPRGTTVPGPADVPRDPGDAPAYAPPRTRNSGEERRGAARDPYTRPAPENDGGSESRAVPRSRSENAPPPQGRSANPPPASPRSGGAVQRGGSEGRAPRAGAPSRGTQQSGPPSSGQGGARRRPGN